MRITDKKFSAFSSVQSKQCLMTSFAFLFFFVTANAQLHFSYGTWDELKQEAAKQKKLIFIDAYTDWCGWCKVMEDETFRDGAVKELMERNFIPVRMEFEQDSFAHKLSLKYMVNIFPSFLVFNAEGKLVYRMSGF